MLNTRKGKILVLVGIIFILSNCIPNAIGSTKAKADNKTTIRSSWSQVAKLLPGDGSSGDFFGSVSFDGNNAFIGSPKDDDNGEDSGSVYVFTNISGTWVQCQKLLASDGAAGDWFGYSVSVDGDTALIGAFFDDDNGVTSGSAYIFIFNGTTWTQQAKLLASDGSSYDWFGYSVSLDGITALVGAGFTSSYVFICEGDVWSQQAILTPSGRATCDALGYLVAISNDTALFGTYVFTCTSGIWSQQAQLVGSDTEPYDNFGWSGDLDGNSAIIGASFDDDLDINSGSAYVFTRTGDTWSQQAKLLAFDGYASDLFGFSVAIDGDRAFVGAADKNGGRGAGYGFLREGTEWIEEGKAIASDGAPMDYFGWSVDLKGDTAVIGAHYDDDYGQDSGSAYVFIKATGNQPPVADFSWTPQNPNPGQTITFDASASHDPDGTIVLYEWDWNNDGVYEESHTTPTATHSWSNAGNYPVTLRVTDDDSATDTETKTVNVIVNQPPVADFSWTPQNPNPGQTITFDASASHDPDGTIVLYEWDWNNDGVYEESHTTPTATHSWSNAGNYPVTVCVTDDDSATGTIIKNVIVVGNEPPAPPTITGPAKGKIGVPTEYNFTTTDSDGDKVYYFIDWGDHTNSSWIGPYSSGDIVTKSHTWSTKGTYTIKAKAKDIYGNESGWATLSVTMPCSYNIPMLKFWEQLLERFPHAFPILRHLLGY
jgi:PKD repeat protein